MIRGTKREMIMLKGDSSSAFECVFFLMRTDIATPRDTGESMLAEANRIISQNRPSRYRRRTLLWRRVKKNSAPFLIGTLFGALAAICTWLALA